MKPICAIVGAGEGLGAALAGRFAAEGFDLALMSRTETGAATAITAASAFAKARHYACDATQPETVEAALSGAAKHGRIEVLIYNVRGGFPRQEPLDMTYADLETSLRAEVIGAFAAAKAVLPAMRGRGRGSIFFSSATAAFRGSAMHPAYAIGKFGLRGLSQSLAKAYGKDGVHIAHMRLDCDLDTPIMAALYGDAYDPASLARPADVAEAYWLTHQQPRGAWSNEVELRPMGETWTY